MAKTLQEIIKECNIPNKEIIINSERMTKKDVGKDLSLIDGKVIGVTGGVYDRIDHHDGYKYFIGRQLELSDELYILISPENNRVPGGKTFDQYLLPIEERTKDMEDFISLIKAEKRVQVIPFQDHADLLYCLISNIGKKFNIGFYTDKELCDGEMTRYIKTYHKIYEDMGCKQLLIPALRDEKAEFVCSTNIRAELDLKAKGLWIEPKKKVHSANLQRNHN